MSTFTIRACLTLITAQLMASCDGPSEYVPAGSNYSGTIALYDEHYIRREDARGVEVTMVERSRSTVTDSLGTWEFTGFTPGTYTFTFRKEGYLPITRRYTTTDAGLMGAMGMFQPPSHRVLDLAAIPTPDGDSVVVSGRVTQRSSPGSRSLVILFGSGESVSNALREHFYDVGVQVPAGQETFRKVIEISGRRFGFSSGDSFYITACATVDFPATQRDPPDSGIDTLRSNVARFVIP